MFGACDVEVGEEHACHAWTKAAGAVEAALPSIPKELIDQFVSGPMSAQAVNAASMAFKKALIERGAELSHHLGSRRGRPSPNRPPTS